MKSKRMRSYSGAGLVSLVTAAMGMQAFAAQWHPSRTQQEVEVVQDQVTASDGAVIMISTAPAVEQGTVPKAEEVLQVESATQALIQITPSIFCFGSQCGGHGGKPAGDQRTAG